MTPWLTYGEDSQQVEWGYGDSVVDVAGGTLSESTRFISVHSKHFIHSEK